MQKLKQFPSLYFILDPSVCKNQNPLKIAIEVLKGGVKLLQLRDKNNDIRMIYHLMISGIAPRPIALVGSYDKNNNYNLAPFSFFNGFGANPPIIGFSPALSGRTGLPKDTLLNIEQTKEFTISVVTSKMVEQRSIMAKVDTGHGDDQHNVPTHTPDGRKLTRQERRKYERLAKKQARSN